MFSLIVGTVNRVTELDRLLTSLSNQTYKDLEVIVVDQNSDDRLLPIISKRHPFPITHLRASRGLSRARNLGLQVAKGEIIAIPDDDCWYPYDLLASVVDWFEQHPDFSGLFTCLRDGDNRRIGSRSPEISGSCTKANLWYRGSPSCFLRKSLVDRVGPFTEKIGPGSDSIYQAGEDGDYFLRAHELGQRMWFEQTLTVTIPICTTQSVCGGLLTRTPLAAGISSALIIAAFL